MRHALILATVLSLTGCSMLKRKSAPATAPDRSAVVVLGNDGTLMAGSLLNGAITLDSGQGELTLLTDHIHSIVISGDSDKIDGDAVKVTGKIKDTRFVLKNEHGLFTLQKDHLQKIDF